MIGKNYLSEIIRRDISGLYLYIWYYIYIFCLIKFIVFLNVICGEEVGFFLVRIREEGKYRFVFYFLCRNRGSLLVFFNYWYFDIIVFFFVRNYKIFS